MRLRSHTFSLLLALELILGLAIDLQAKTIPPLPAKRKDAIAFIQKQIQRADSAGDERSSVDWRRELMAYCTRVEQEALDAEIWQFVDSVPNLLDEMLAMHLSNASMYRTTGKWKLACEESERAIDLTRRIVERNCDMALQAVRATLQRAISERDSLNRNWELALQDARHRESGMEATAERWFFSALGIGAAWALTVLLFLVSLRRQRNRTHEELEALRTEIAAMKEAPRNRFRDPAPTAAVEPPPVEPPAPAPPIEAPVAVDAAALAIFRRMAPERLEALNDARSRGDHEKVLRVVHTLKPHLEALDPDGLGALCLRIKAMNVVERDVELDRLLRGIQVLLG